MKWKLKMFTKNYELIRTNSTIVVTQKTPHISIKQIKKVIGKFKDEASGIPIKEFIGLRSKMYSYIK